MAPEPRVEVHTHACTTPRGTREAVMNERACVRTRRTQRASRDRTDDLMYIRYDTCVFSRRSMQERARLADNRVSYLRAARIHV